MNFLRGWEEKRRLRSLSAFLNMPLKETTFEEVWIDQLDGPRVYAHLHRPKEAGNYPGVIMIPGGGSAGTDYDRGAFIRASELAALGFLTLHYDPSGRGLTGGEEGHWGVAHQRELSRMIDHLSTHPELSRAGISLFSISIGITIATGCLSRFPNPLVKCLFDWEGPSNRTITTKNDSHPPLQDYPCKNNEFWGEREAVRYIGDLSCGYFRYQAELDHVQGESKEHAVELINGALDGKALWTRCNDNPEGIRLDSSRLSDYRWVSRKDNHNGMILKYFLEAQAR
ncbi:MAG: hypothetical protein HQL52_09920 [Magnetococcales bacterium]|nr:hypothetical protein [Magnetococcales bacterium]